MFGASVELSLSRGLPPGLRSSHSQETPLFMELGSPDNLGMEEMLENIKRTTLQFSRNTVAKSSTCSETLSASLASWASGEVPHPGGPPMFTMSARIHLSTCRTSQVRAHSTWGRASTSHFSACPCQLSHLTSERSSSIRSQGAHPCLLAGAAGESLLRLKVTYGFHLLG